MRGGTASGMQFDNVLAMWRRRKWLALCAFAGVFSVGAALTAFLPNVYQAAATILVVGQQVPADFVKTTVTGALDTRLQTISQQILSRARLEELINRFGLYANLKRDLTLEALVERMRRDIEVKPTGIDRIGGTVAFTIRYQGRDPRTVALVTNTLASYYIDENIRVRERQATSTADFLRTQLDEVKKRLEVQERRVSEFRRRYLGELPTQMDANLQTLERLNTQFRLNGERQMRVREQRQEQARRLDSAALRAASTPSRARPAAAGAAAADPAEARLEKLKDNLAELRSRFHDRYPDVVHLQREIAELEEQLAATKPRRSPAAGSSTEPDPLAPAADPQVDQIEQALGQLNVELKALKEEEAHLRAAMVTYQTRVDNTPRRDLEFQELSRDYDSTRELYSSLMKRYEEAQLAESMEQRQKGEQFRVLDPAIPSPQPGAPNRVRLLIVTLLFSLGLSVGAMLLAEYVDTSFHEVDDLRAFSNVPVLASIPRILTRTDLRRRWWRVRLGAAVALVGLVVIVSLAYVAANGNERLVLLLGRVAS